MVMSSVLVPGPNAGACSSLLASSFTGGTNSSCSPTSSCFSPSSATGAGVGLSATGSACGAALSSTESGPSTAWAAMGCAATQAVRATDMAASFSFLFVMIDGSFQMVSSLLRITTVPYNGHVSRFTILLPLYHFLVQVVKKKYVETHDL